MVEETFHKGKKLRGLSRSGSPDQQ